MTACAVSWGEVLGLLLWQLPLKQEPILEALVARPPLFTSCCWVPGEQQMSLMLYF